MPWRNCPLRRIVVRCDWRVLDFCFVLRSSSRSKKLGVGNPPEIPGSISILSKETKMVDANIMDPFIWLYYYNIYIYIIYNFICSIYFYHFVDREIPLFCKKMSAIFLVLICEGETASKRSCSIESLCSPWRGWDSFSFDCRRKILMEKVNMFILNWYVYSIYIFSKNIYFISSM